MGTIPHGIYNNNGHERGRRVDLYLPVFRFLFFFSSIFLIPSPSFLPYCPPPPPLYLFLLLFSALSYVPFPYVRFSYSAPRALVSLRPRETPKLRFDASNIPDSCSPLYFFFLSLSVSFFPPQCETLPTRSSTLQIQSRAIDSPSSNIFFLFLSEIKFAPSLLDDISRFSTTRPFPGPFRAAFLNETPDIRQYIFAYIFAFCSSAMKNCTITHNAILCMALCTSAREQIRELLIVSDQHDEHLSRLMKSLAAREARRGEARRGELLSAIYTPESRGFS